MKAQEAINELSPLIGYRIRFPNGHEQNCISIEETITEAVFLDGGELHEDGTQIGYYVLPRNIECIEHNGDILRLIGNKRSGTITRLHKIGDRNAEEAT